MIYSVYHVRCYDHEYSLMFVEHVHSTHFCTAKLCNIYMHVYLNCVAFKTLYVLNDVNIDQTERIQDNMFGKKYRFCMR